MHSTSSTWLPSMTLGTSSRPPAMPWHQRTTNSHAWTTFCRVHRQRSALAASVDGDAWPGPEDGPKSSPKVIEAEQVDGKLPEGVGHRQPDEAEVERRKRWGRVIWGWGWRGGWWGWSVGGRVQGGGGGMWTGFSYCFVDLKSTERQPRDDVDAAYDDIHDVEVESAHSRDVIVALPVAPKAGREDVEVDAGERHARRK